MKRPGTPSDALRDTMGAGCMAALDAMAKMVGGAPWRLGLIEHVPLPRLKSLALGDLGTLGACVSVRIGGTVGGLFVMALDSASAKALSALLLGKPAHAASPELLDSALCELCNIAACTFGIGVQGRTGGTMTPSIPSLVYGELAGSVIRISASFKATDALTVQFLSEQGDTAGRFVWTLSSGELAALTNMLERAR